MKSLIVPMAGMSTRYNTNRPKWMLTHPKTKRFMGLEAISSINIDFFDFFHFIFLKQHQDDFLFRKGFEEELKSMNIYEKSVLTFLDHPTNSQPETVSKCIEYNNISGFIFIKDSDSFFKTTIKQAINQVCYIDLCKVSHVDAKSKSYIAFDANKTISRISEKNIISSSFSVGGYGFQYAEEFLDFCKYRDNNSENLYISNVIETMMLSNKMFLAQEVTDYDDLGTQKDWDLYCKQYKTLFVDIDGVLVENSSTHFPPYHGNGRPLTKNIERLKEMHQTGKVQIILTTARDLSLKAVTIDELNRHDIPYDDIIMGLHHGKRIIINDFSATNSYPSCEAVNVLRNSDDLNNYI